MQLTYILKYLPVGKCYHTYDHLCSYVYTHHKGRNSCSDDESGENVSGMVLVVCHTRESREEGKKKRDKYQRQLESRSLVEDPYTSNIELRCVYVWIDWLGL